MDFAEYIPRFAALGCSAEVVDQELFVTAALGRDPSAFAIGEEAVTYRCASPSTADEALALIATERNRRAALCQRDDEERRAATAPAS